MLKTHNETVAHSSMLPTELWLDILDPLVSPRYRLSAPQSPEVVQILCALCLTNRALNRIVTPYLYDCLWVQSPAQLDVLLSHSLLPSTPRRVRTLIYSGPLLSFPTTSVEQLLTRVAPTLERLFLNIVIRMPFATYHNPLLLLRPVLHRAPNLHELGSFSNASDEIVFPLQRQGRRGPPDPPPELLEWPGIRRVALVSLTMDSALHLAALLPNVRAIALPAQALEDAFVIRLDSILRSLPSLSASQEGEGERKDLIWVRHKDDEDEGDASGAWFLFHFLPVIQALAQKHRERIRVWLCFAPVGRGGLGRWMMQRMLGGEMWRDKGVRMGVAGLGLPLD